MNPIQKQWLGLGVAVMLIMLICPPWTRITRRVVMGTDGNLMQTESQDFAGYSLLFEPPQAFNENRFRFAPTGVSDNAAHGEGVPPERRMLV